MSKRLFTKIKPELFKPRFVHGLKENNSNSYVNTNTYISEKESDNILYNTNFESTSSFRYNNKIGVVSTQEMNIDYSQFENHTFFNSAIAKVNEAFDKIINYYPYDGSLKTIESFEEELTGHEKYILDQFPKNIGYLNFSGSQNILEGTYIKVIDNKGVDNLNLSSATDGSIILDPLGKSFTIQTYINIPSIINDNQIIVQKKKDLAENFTLALSESNDINTCNIIFGITSGSNYNFVSASIKKGEFNHVTAMYDRYNDNKVKLIIFDNKDQKTVVSSSMSTEFGILNYNGSNLMIGAGSECRLNNEIFTPVESFSGSLDDFKIHHKFINELEVYETKNHTEYNNDKLVLYYKFNEPYGTYNGNDIILDSSGNSLNTNIQNFSLTNRLTGSTSPISGEDIERSPVLFPDYTDVLNLHTNLLTSASYYDEVNPNLITRLVPKHYFIEGSQDFDNTRPLGNISTDFENLTGIRGTQNIPPSAQLLTRFLLTWAKFFDEIKIFIDNFSLITHVDYDNKNTIADKYLYDLGKKYGIELPPLFSNASSQQIFKNENVNFTQEKIAKNLFQIQNLLWRNILTSFPSINKKKGTIESVKSIFRSIGIEADNLFKIREYGGSKTKSLDGSKEIKKDVIKFLNFSGSYDHYNESVDNQGNSSTSPFIRGKFLSSSRKEIGYPTIRGSYVDKNNIDIHGISNVQSDGLLTSGSFTYQGTYKFSKKVKHENKQSLVRLHATGSVEPASYEGAYVNLVADKENQRIDMFFVDSPISTDIHRLYLTGVNVFDSDPWTISFGRNSSESIKSENKSNYFLRAGKFNNGKTLSIFSTSSLYDDQGNYSINSNINNYNRSGSFITIGSQSLNPGAGAGKYLNNGNDNEKYTIFSGEVTSINFWSKGNSIDEFIKHGNDILSIGSKNPLINYNHNYLESGSFERMRMQTFAKQSTVETDSSGNITFFDLSQNNFHLDGTGFESNKNVFSPHYIIRSSLDYDFDLNTSEEKIRVRSYNSLRKANKSIFASTTPIYEVRKSEEVIDDTRLSIDLSVMKGLNENIMRIFSDMSFFDNALGKPNILFSNYYRDIIAMRRMYFNDVLDKLNLEKYRNLFKWIDNSMTDLIYSFIPRTTNFLGINFIYESHVLERHRLKYLYNSMYNRNIPPEPEIQSFDNNNDNTYEANVNPAPAENDDPPPSGPTFSVPSINASETVDPEVKDENNSESSFDDTNTGNTHHQIPRDEKNHCLLYKEEMSSLISQYESGRINLEDYNEKYEIVYNKYLQECVDVSTTAKVKIGDRRERKEYIETNTDSSDSSSEGTNENSSYTRPEEDTVAETEPQPDPNDTSGHDTGGGSSNPDHGDGNSRPGMTAEEIEKLKNKQREGNSDGTGTEEEEPKPSEPYVDTKTEEEPAEDASYPPRQPGYDEPEDPIPEPDQIPSNEIDKIGSDTGNLPDPNKIGWGSSIANGFPPSGNFNGGGMGNFK